MIDVEALARPLASEPSPERVSAQLISERASEPSPERSSVPIPSARLPLSASIKHSVSLDDRACSHDMTDGVPPLSTAKAAIAVVPSLPSSKGLSGLPNRLGSCTDRNTRSVGGDPSGKAQQV